MRRTAALPWQRVRAWPLAEEEPGKERRRGGGERKVTEKSLEAGLVYRLASSEKAEQPLVPISTRTILLRWWAKKSAQTSLT
jgi:hypothetical protein